jgi:hypothetical protein
MKSQAGTRFWTLFRKLPDDIQRLAVKTYRLWRANPNHPSLRYRRRHRRSGVRPLRSAPQRFFRIGPRCGLRSTGGRNFVVVQRYSAIGSEAMNSELLMDLARHQAWADAAHWKAIHENTILRDDAEIRTRLNHMVNASRLLTGLARREAPNLDGMKEVFSIDELESAMGKAHRELAATLGSADLDRMIALPRGPQGPFELKHQPAYSCCRLLLTASITEARTRRGCANWGPRRL